MCACTSDHWLGVGDASGALAAPFSADRAFDAKCDLSAVCTDAVLAVLLSPRLSPLFRTNFFLLHLSRATPLRRAVRMRK